MEKKDLGEILESYLARTESGSFLFEKTFFLLLEGDQDLGFALTEGSGSTAVCPGYISNGTGQPTMLLQKLRVC